MSQLPVMKIPPVSVLVFVSTSMSIAPFGNAGPESDHEPRPAPTSTPRVISLLGPEAMREHAERVRNTLEYSRENGSISRDQYRHGIHEYKKEIEKYREQAKSDKR
jgi:hypothetical protein